MGLTLSLAYALTVGLLVHCGYYGVAAGLVAFPIALITFIAWLKS